jgi:predicted Zn-dependent protease
MKAFMRAFCLVVFVAIIGLNTRASAACAPWISQDAQQGDAAATPPTANDLLNQQTEKNVQALTDRLFLAVDQLIPGDFGQNAPLPPQIKEAIALFVRGDRPGSYAKFQQLTKDNATLPPPQLLTAALYFALNQMDVGKLLLERAAIDVPDYPGVYTALARVAINQSSWAASAALLAQLRQKIDSGTWNEDQKKHFELEYLDALADTMLGQQRWDEAKKHLTELQTQLPQNASVPFRLADVDFNQENVDGALANLTKARSLDSNLYPPELVLYQWFSRRNNVEEAETWIKSASEKYPDEKTVQLEYGKFLLERGDLTPAAKWVEKAEKSGANISITRFMQGQISFMRRSYSVAEATFNELYLQNPNDVGVRNMLVLSLIESEDPVKRQKALELATANVRFNANNPQLASTMAWVHYQLGNTQQSKQILSQIATLPSFPSDTAYYISRLLVDEGQYENAGKLLTETLKAPGLFLYRLRAEADLPEINKKASEASSKTSGSGDSPK